MAAIKETIDWEDGKLAELLEEHCALDADTLEDEDGEEEDAIAIELEIPASLVEHLGDDPERCVEFVQWLLSDESD